MCTLTALHMELIKLFGHRSRRAAAQRPVGLFMFSSFYSFAIITRPQRLLIKGEIRRAKENDQRESAASECRQALCGFLICLCGCLRFALRTPSKSERGEQQLMAVHAESGSNSLAPHMSEVEVPAQIRPVRKQTAHDANSATAA